MKTCSFLPVVRACSPPAWAVVVALLSMPGGTATGQEAGNASAAEALQIFDTNDDRHIDADELAAMQRAFVALKKLDANSDGEIGQAELERLNTVAATAWTSGAAGAAEGRGRSLMSLQEVDKNGNRQVDPEEVADLEKLLGRGKMMDRLDLNGNGKLEPEEVKLINERLGQRDGSLLGAFRSRFGGRSSAPAESKAPEPVPANPLNIPPPIVPPRPEDEKPAPVPQSKPKIEPDDAGASAQPPCGFGT